MEPFLLALDYLDFSVALVILSNCQRRVHVIPKGNAVRFLIASRGGKTLPIADIVDDG